MAKFYWIGQTLTTSTKLNAFTWNNPNNWREEYIPKQQDAVVQLVKNAIPNNAPRNSDLVFIGVPLADPNGNRLYCRSPLLFGGVTGAIAPDSAYQGWTWESGSYTGGCYFNIAGGASFDDGYSFRMIGGGITGGGQGYWNSFQDFKNWAISYYNITNTNDINTIFSATEIAGKPNLNQLKIKALKVTETAQPTQSLLVSMQIPRTWATGTTFACTEYIKQGKNITTKLDNSVILKITNIASRTAQTGTGGIITAPVAVNNNMVLSTCVIHRYEGYYDDNVTIKNTTKVTSAEIGSPASYNNADGTVSSGFANGYFALKLGGKYGAYYTSSYLGLTGIPPTDGQLVLSDTKSQVFGQQYQPLYQVLIGDQGSGVTGYIKSLVSTNNTVMFTGKMIVGTMDSNNCYIGYVSTSSYWNIDTINITTLNMKNQSTLDLTVTPQFDRWFFGTISNLPVGNTLIQGGIYAFGNGNKLYGSPGVNLYNDILIATPGLSRRIGNKPDTFTWNLNTSATGDQVAGAL